MTKNVSRSNDVISRKNNITVGKDIKSNDIGINKRNEKRVHTKRKITVIGDSIVKNIQLHKMKNTLGDDRLYIKSFSGAPVVDMLDYSKPILRMKPDVIIYHTGTNNLCTDDTPNEIASNIINHALEM